MLIGHPVTYLLWCKALPLMLGTAVLPKFRTPAPPVTSRRGSPRCRSQPTRLVRHTFVPQLSVRRMGCTQYSCCSTGFDSCGELRPATTNRARASGFQGALTAPGRAPAATAHRCTGGRNGADPWGTAARLPRRPHRRPGRAGSVSCPATASRRPCERTPMRWPG